MACVWVYLCLHVPVCVCVCVCVYLQQVLLEAQLVLCGGAEGSYGRAHELLGVHLTKLLQHSQGGPAVLLLIQEDLHVGNHAQLPHRHWDTDTHTPQDVH